MAIHSLAVRTWRSGQFLFFIFCNSKGKAKQDELSMGSNGYVLVENMSNAKRLIGEDSWLQEFRAGKACRIKDLGSNGTSSGTLGWGTIP